MSPRIGGRPSAAAMAWLIGALTLITALAGCVQAGGSEGSRSLAAVWTLFTWGGVLVTAIVAVLTTWAVLRYRRKPDALPEQVGGSIRLEAIWTALPLVAVLALFVVSLEAFWVAQPGAGKAGDVRLEVTAFRWGWQFLYPDSDRVVTSAPGSVPEIVLPVDRTIHVTLASRDVVHAFFIPNFLFKRDAIPGRPTTFDLRVVQPGIFGGVCAEYCGVLHDEMPFAIRAVPGDQFDAWLLGTPP